MGQSKIDRDVWEGFNPNFNNLDNIRNFIEFNRDRLRGSEGRKEDSKRVYDYYKGVRQSTLLREELRKRFPKTYLLRRLSTENVTAAIVNQMSVVYKSPPKRNISFPQTELAEGEELSPEVEAKQIEERDGITASYEAMIKELSHDKQMQKLERYQSFDRSNLIQIGYHQKAEEIVEDVIPQFLFDVMVDDEGSIVAVIKSSFFGDSDKEDKFRRYWAWTDEEMWLLDNDLQIKTRFSRDGRELENINPYGEIPFVFLKAIEPDIGVYCDANNMLPDLNLNVNLLLTDLNYMSEMQSHGQPVAINCRFPVDVKFGMETILELEQKDEDGPPPSFEFLQTNANFDGVFQTLERILIGYTKSVGLPDNMFSVDKAGGTASGVSLKIRNAPLIEFRQSMEETYRRHEEAILKKQILVWNFNKERHGFAELPEDLVVNITYTDPQEAFETPTDRVTTMLKLLASGLMKPTEIVMENHPTFNEDDAAKHLVEVKEEKTKFMGGNVGSPTERAANTFNLIANGNGENGVQSPEGQ